MLKFLKWSTCGIVDLIDSPGMEAVSAEQVLDYRKFVLPRFWVSHEESSKVTTLRIKLPSCKREWISVNIWNERHLRLLASSELNCFKLLYKLPLEARLLDYPRFSTANGILTCRFQESSPKCIVCASAFTRDSSIESEGSYERTSAFDAINISEADSLSSRSSYELMQPRYWITYDENTALFEADLTGCNGPSQIKFHIDNDRLALLACSRDQWRYFLRLRLESSTQDGWKAYFDHKMEMLICNIPLLGHYKCDRCMAGGIRLDPEVNGQTADRASGVEVKENTYWHSKNVVGRKPGPLSTSTPNCASNYCLGQELELMDVTDYDQPIKF